MEMLWRYGRKLYDFPCSKDKQKVLRPHTFSPKRSHCQDLLASMERHLLATFSKQFDIIFRHYGHASLFLFFSKFPVTDVFHVYDIYDESTRML